LDSERFRGFGHSSVVLREYGCDVLTLEPFARLSQRSATRESGWAPVEAYVHQHVGDSNQPARNLEHKPVEQTPELRQVPTPWQRSKEHRGLSGRRLGWKLQRGANLDKEVPGEGRNILPPLTQRRNLYRGLGKAVSEVRMHPIITRHRIECRDRPKFHRLGVGLDIFRREPDFAIAQQACEPGLKSPGHFCQVKKNKRSTHCPVERASFGNAVHAFRRGINCRGRTPEQLLLEILPTRAINDHKRPNAPDPAHTGAQQLFHGAFAVSVTSQVDRSRKQLEVGPNLPIQQHTAFARDGPLEPP
jgi:hypothetical protein